MNVDITTLRYFAHVAAANSFVRGAARAHVTPPAVSKAIRKLEDDLGVKLFERTTRRVLLTRAGEVALERARRVMAELDGLEADLAASAGRPGGPLRIAAMEVFSIELLPNAVSGLVSEHPEILPLCFEMLPEQMNERLLAGELDVGFTIGATARPGLERHELGSSRGLLVCGKDHPLYRRGRVTAKDLERYPSVVPRFFGAEHLPSLDQFSEHEHPRRIGATIELLQMGVQLVASGRYLGYFPEISLRGHLATGVLRPLQGLKPQPPFALHALSRDGLPLKPSAALLIKRVTAAIAGVKRRSA